MTKQETDNYIKIGLAILAVIVVLYILSQFSEGLKSIFESLGLKSTEEEKKISKGQEKASEKAEKEPAKVNPWNTSLFNDLKTGKVKQNVNLFKDKTASANAAAIYKAIGRGFGSSDNPEQIEAVIKLCPNKYAVSQLVAKYLQLYKKDMYSDIKQALYTEEKGTAFPGDWTPTKQKEAWKRILDYVDNLPLIS